MFGLDETYTTIESKYGVDQGDDWLAVRMAAPFKQGETVTFCMKFAKTDGSTGVILDMRRLRHKGCYEFLVQYNNRNIPRWTNISWLLPLDDNAPVRVLPPDKLHSTHWEIAHHLRQGFEITNIPSNQFFRFANFKSWYNKRLLVELRNANIIDESCGLTLEGLVWVTANS